MKWAIGRMFGGNNQSSAEIARNGTEVVYRLDPRGKTYTTTSYATLRAQLDQAQAKQANCLMELFETDDEAEVRRELARRVVTPHESSGRMFVSDYELEPKENPP